MELTREFLEKRMKEQADYIKYYEDLLATSVNSIMPDSVCIRYKDLIDQAKVQYEYYFKLIYGSIIETKLMEEIILLLFYNFRLSIKREANTGIRVTLIRSNNESVSEFTTFQQIDKDLPKIIEQLRNKLYIKP